MNSRHVGKRTGTGATVPGQVTCLDMLAPCSSWICWLQGKYVQTTEETDTLTKDGFQEQEAIHTSSLSVGKLRTDMFYGILK